MSGEDGLRVGRLWHDGLLVADPLLGSIIPKLGPNVGSHLVNGSPHYIPIFALVS